MTFIWGFDFGETTGVTYGLYGPNTAFTLLEVWEVPNGVDGFINWWRWGPSPMKGDTVVAEEFVLNPGNQFTANLDGVPHEGALRALWDEEIHWQRAAAKAGVPDEVLKAHGLWKTGKDVGHVDARDVNDATIHVLEYLRRTMHLPTLREYFKED